MLKNYLFLTRFIKLIEWNYVIVLISFIFNDNQLYIG